MNKIFRTSFDSEKRIMPSMAVPTAPIPVQTAYADPTGNVLSEIDKSQMLIAIQIAVKIEGQNLVKPLEYLRPIAQLVSKRPAINRIIQTIFDFMLFF
jgi:hypothetical protein